MPSYEFLGKDKAALESAIKSSQAEIPVIFATQTQTCKNFAGSVCRQLQLASLKCKAINVSEVKPSDIQGPLVIYLTCTFFNGEHPKSAANFVAALKNKDAEWKNALTGKHFAVFGIGSTKYKLFCVASDEVDKLLEENGAHRIQPVSRVDRALPQGHEPQFYEWLDALLVNTGIPKVEDNKSVYNLSVLNKYPHIAPPKGYVWAKLVERKQLSFSVIDGIQVYYKFVVPANSYKAGQHMGILPRNSHSVVEKLFQLKVLYIDDECKISAEPEQHVKIDINVKEGANLPLSNEFNSVWDLVSQYIDLHAQFNQKTVEQFSNYATDAAHKTEMKRLASPAAFQEFQDKFSKNPTKVADIFSLWPSIKVPIVKLLEYCPVQSHRLYSIASSPKLIGETALELLVTEVFFDSVDLFTGEKISVRGLTTGFLNELAEKLGNYKYGYLDREGLFPMNIHGSPLEPPTDAKTPIISICLGSGYAPFRSLFQEREALQKQGVELGPSACFLGLRRRMDYGFMLDELNDWCKLKVTDAYLAISREKETPADFAQIPMTHEKRAENVHCLYGGYVTKCIAEHYKIFGEHMLQPLNYILYCGKAGQVPNDLQNYITQALVKCGVEEAKAKQMWVDYMEKGRIILEAW